MAEIEADFRPTPPTNCRACGHLLHSDERTAGICLDCSCDECEGYGWLPADGCGDQSGGWAETCQECRGSGARAGVGGVGAE
jgi:hypothetical protein